ncbi:hypothetical protein GCM10023187_16790 [Nibrella viscosa]|uniref:Lipoprotein n=1 Tax=Nibrella viscosa TaxID=1084524 RepID=A0ABP8K8U8_9BACT
MKNQLFLLMLSGAMMSCGEYGHYTDTANDAAGTGGNYIAKDVSGLYILSPDHEYERPCNYMSAAFIKDMFNIPLTTELTTIDVPNGCEFQWGNSRVGVAFAKPNPYESMYHAEYIFNMLFQPGDPQVLGQLSRKYTLGEDYKARSIFGPKPSGLAAEWPTSRQVRLGITQESTLPNDTATTTAGPTTSPAATQFVLPVETTQKYIGLIGVGDKAVWEPGTQILRVLYLNHIISLKVQTPATEKVRQQQAVNLANFIMDELITKR